MNGKTKSKTPVTEFCEERCVPKKIETLFSVFCRVTLAEKFMMNKDGDTIRIMLDKLTQGQIEGLWVKFVIELKGVIKSTGE